jgi:hypothetical protein
MKEINGGGESWEERERLDRLLIKPVVERPAACTSLKTWVENK